MPLHIGRVDADVNIARAADPAQAGAPAASSSPASGIDMERLRPMVVQILQEELASVQRQQG